MHRRVKYYSAKRRRIYAAGAAIDPLAVFEREQWICYCCGEEIDRTQRHNDKSASVEHIIPLSAYTQVQRVYSELSQDPCHPANITVSHRLCNQRRGNSYTELDIENVLIRLGQAPEV